MSLRRKFHISIHHRDIKKTTNFEVHESPTIITTEIHASSTFNTIYPVHTRPPPSLLNRWDPQADIETRQRRDRKARTATVHIY